MRPGLRRSRQPAASGSPPGEAGQASGPRPLADDSPPRGEGANGDSTQPGKKGREGAAAEPGENVPERAAEPGENVPEETPEPGKSVPEGAAGPGKTGTGEAAEPGAAGQPAPATLRLPRLSLDAVGSRLGRLPLVPALAGPARRSRAAASRAGARAAATGWQFSRLTLLPVLLVVAWLIPAIPLLLAGSFAAAPMLVISLPLALVLILIGLRQVPDRWPASAQARAGPGGRAPWWAVLGTIAVAGGFAAWQIAENSQQLAVAGDQGTSLQLGYWIAQHGSVSIPVSAAAFGGAHPGLSFASAGFVQHGGSLSAQFLAGLPSVIAAAFWAGGIHASLLVPPVLGGLAVLAFAGLAARLVGPRWAPAAAVVLAVALPEQYTSRSTFGEPLVQVLLFGGLCLFIDSLGTARRPGRPGRWWRTGPGPDTVLAALGGLALGLATTVQVDALNAVLPAIPVIGIMVAARKPQWLPFSTGLVAGVGYGLAAGYVLARPSLDPLSSWMRTFGITALGVTAVTAAGVLLARFGGKLRPKARRVLAARRLHWLPEAAAGLVVLAAIGFAIRPYVQTVRADSGKSVVAYVGYLQRVAGLPLDPRRLYAEDTLYWVVWYIGLPALLLGVFGLALLARRLVRALITWSDPFSAALVWALPLLMIGWVTVSVLWRPGTTPDQPWASRRLVPLVLPGLILAATWAAAWLTGQAGRRGAGKGASFAVAVFCVGALLLPTLLTTFGIGVAATGRPQPGSAPAGLAWQRTGQGELAAVDGLCAAIGSGASVVIVDPGVANSFTQLIRGACDTPTARMNRPTPLSVQPVVAGIQRVGRRPVLLGGSQAQLAQFGGQPREIVNLVTTQDAHELTRPPTTTWPIHYVIWMNQPG